jgi:EAL domain-containing protein (putative c-di-GMP-specific phosphodiesterase class I)
MLLVGAAVTIGALLCGALDVWATLSGRTLDEANAAMRFVDSRLDAIDTEMTTLAADATADTSWSACAPFLSKLLTRTSLASLPVQKYMIGRDGDDTFCRPDGRGAALFLPFEPRDRLSLTSTGEIATHLTVARRIDAHGGVIVGVLDSRALEPRPGEPQQWQDDPQARVSLLSADGRRLATLGLREPTPPFVPGLRAVIPSEHRDVLIAAEVERDTLIAMAWRRIPVVVMVCWLLLGAGVSIAWRRTLLRSRLYHRIERGLHKREFVPFVQPIVELASGQCAGAEILMRWHHPHRGMLTPFEFIDEAERTGLIVGMSDLVMSRAAHQLAAIATEYPNLYFSFNLTPAQIALPQLPGRLAELFTAETIPRDRILLELTERELVDATTIARLNALRDEGWRIAIDDFGTGHSSLAALEQLKLDRLKIDRAFVSTIDEETVNRPVLDSIIDLSSRMQMAMIAEGVETRAQWEYLAARGVQYAQGYLVARPLPIDAFAEWLAAQQVGTPSSVATLARAEVKQVVAPDAVAQRLWNALRTPGGLDCRDRMFRMRTYSNCFVGRDAVDWIVTHHVVSRADAVRMLQRLTALGLISHVLDEHDFEDAELFYRLAAPTTASKVTGPAAGEVRAALRSASGLPLQTHVRGILSHRECTTGADMVTWIEQRFTVTRATAVQWAIQLMREGALRHVFDDRPFRDDSTLYRPA